MELPEVADLATYCNLPAAPSGAQGTTFKQCLDMAIEYVEGEIGDLDKVEEREALCREAIFIIAKHEWGLVNNPSVRGGQMMGMPEGMPSPAGYLIPHRAKTLIDSLRYYNPDSIGIG